MRVKWRYKDRTWVMQGSPSFRIHVRIGEDKYSPRIQAEMSVMEGEAGK